MNLVVDEATSPPHDYLHATHNKKSPLENKRALNKRVLTEVKLPGEVGECLVCVCHSVRIFSFGDRSAFFAVSSH